TVLDLGPRLDPLPDPAEPVRDAPIVRVDEGPVRPGECRERLGPEQGPGVATFLLGLVLIGMAWGAAPRADERRRIAEHGVVHGDAPGAAEGGAGLGEPALLEERPTQEPGRFGIDRVRGGIEVTEPIAGLGRPAALEQAADQELLDLSRI